MDLPQLERFDRKIARHRPLHDPRVDQVDGEVVAHDATDCASPSDDRRDAILVDAVLGGDNVAVGGEIGRDQGPWPRSCHMT